MRSGCRARESIRVGMAALSPSSVSAAARNSFTARELSLSRARMRLARAARVASRGR